MRSIEEKEVWHNIKGYENLYMVSNTGKIKRLSRVVENKGSYSGKYILKEKEMKLHFNKDGYAIVNLSKNNTKKAIKVHRLVAEAFIPNPNEYFEINHINEIKDDNRVENLEWCDRKYNVNYGLRNKKTSISESKEIIQLDLSNNILNKFYGIREASRNTKIQHSHIAECCMGKRKTAGGFKWKYNKRDK